MKKSIIFLAVLVSCRLLDSREQSQNCIEEVILVNSTEQIIEYFPSFNDCHECKLWSTIVSNDTVKLSYFNEEMNIRDMPNNIAYVDGTIKYRFLVEIEQLDSIKANLMFCDFKPSFKNYIIDTDSASIVLLRNNGIYTIVDYIKK